MFGHFTAASKTGRSGLKNISTSFVLTLFLVTLCQSETFNSKSILVASHNLHSFKTSSAYHKACLNKHGGIWMAQELWLTEKQLPLLHQLDTQFIARSGMEEAVSAGVLRGRPFGGVSTEY